MRLEGKKVLVTGGNAGIGLALTRQLVSAGAHVLICGRDQSRLEAVRDAHPGSVTAFTLDLADRSAVSDFCRTLAGEHDDLSIVINNAGIQDQIDFFSTGLEDGVERIGREMEINTASVMVLCLGLIPILRKRPEAAIINISSALGLVPKRSAPVYCASKAAIRSFTKVLRYQAEAAGAPIAVTDVIMALVDTGMTEGRGKGKISPDAAAQEVLQGILKDRRETWVGKTRMLRMLYRFNPAVAERLLRDG